MKRSTSKDASLSTVKKSESGTKLTALAGKFMSTLPTNKSKLNSPSSSLQDIIGTYKKEVQTAESASSSTRRCSKKTKVKRSKSSTDGVRKSKSNPALPPIRRVTSSEMVLVDTTKRRSLSPKRNTKTDKKDSLLLPPPMVKARSSGGKPALPPLLRRVQTSDGIPRGGGLPKRTKSLPLRRIKSAELPRPVKGILKKENAAATTTKPKSLLNNAVEFDVTEVREYPYILDQSRTEVMLTLDWTYQAQKVDSVEEFELQKAFCKSVGLVSDGGPRRYQVQERAGILLRSGLTVSELGKELKSRRAHQPENNNNDNDRGKSVHPLKKFWASSKRKTTFSASA